MNCPSQTDEPPQHLGWNQNLSGSVPRLRTRGEANLKVTRWIGETPSIGVEDAHRKAPINDSQDDRSEEDPAKAPIDDSQNDEPEEDPAKAPSDDSQDGKIEEYPAKAPSDDSQDDKSKEDPADPPSDNNLETEYTYSIVVEDAQTLPSGSVPNDGNENSDVPSPLSPEGNDGELRLTSFPTPEIVNQVVSRGSRDRSRSCSRRDKSRSRYETIPRRNPLNHVRRVEGNLVKFGKCIGSAFLASGGALTKFGKCMGSGCLASGRVLSKFGKFLGPGFMVSVAYIDPGNYSTDVAAGVVTKFKLLFIVMMSSIFAIVFQSLAVRLGTVTGLNLAEHCKAHFPGWLNIVLYILGECAIIATDIAEVTGSAIALNLLLKIPLVAGCAITMFDVMVILIFYRPDGDVRGLRYFEIFVMALVLGVVICFCIQLSYIHNASAGEVLKGYLPSSTIVKGQGLYLSCGIIGATVMPHSLYLGSGMVQARLRDFDTSTGNIAALDTTDTRIHKPYYKPSLAAIRECLSYSTAEVVIALGTFALFVNSAILIVAGASLSSDSATESGNLFGIFDLLSKTIGRAAGIIFALALLLSGTSAGIVCTIAGQLLSEGALNWSMPAWVRRLVTRSISITPSIIIAAAVGKDGLSAALNGTQYALSIILPFVSAPLIYFTCRNKYMEAGASDTSNREDTENEPARVKMRNHWALSVIAIMIWLVIAIMNVASLVFLGLGKA